MQRQQWRQPLRAASTLEWQPPWHRCGRSAARLGGLKAKLAAARSRGNTRSGGRKYGSSWKLAEQHCFPLECHICGSQSSLLDYVLNSSVRAFQWHSWVLPLQAAESGAAQAHRTASLAVLHRSSQQADWPLGWAQRQPAGNTAALQRGEAVANSREQLAAAEAASPPGTAAASAMRSAGPLGSGGAGRDPGNNNLLVVIDSDPQVTGEWMQQQQQRFAGLHSQAQEQQQQEQQHGELSVSSPANSSAKHAAIFRLVFGLLQGPNQR